MPTEITVHHLLVILDGVVAYGAIRMTRSSYNITCINFITIDIPTMGSKYIDTRYGIYYYRLTGIYHFKNPFSLILITVGIGKTYTAHHTGYLRR